MVGTAVNTVMSPDDRRSHTRSASKAGSISHVARTASAEPSPLMMPCTWCSGSTSSRWSEGFQPHASTSDAICAPMFWCVVTTPLGRPVVPLV